MVREALTHFGRDAAELERAWGSGAATPYGDGP